MTSSPRIQLTERILDGERIQRDEALPLFSFPLAELGFLADRRRELIKPGQDVGFILDRIINYTNICVARCEFCAFHAEGGRVPPYELGIEEICTKIEELVRAGGTQIMFQGGLHPEHTLSWYVDLVQTVRSRFPNIYLHSFSPAEVVHIANRSGCGIDEVVGALKQAGVNSIPGASDLLVDRIRRQVSPAKCSCLDWRNVIRTCAEHGMTSTATMTYGMGETPEERLLHLQEVRDVQDETGILRAFIPWSFSPANTQLSDRPQASAVDYLRIVSVARIFLDNILHIQAGWLTEGHKLAQVALSMGANDMGGVLTEELVVRATGVTNQMTATDMVDLIRDTGKTPVRRDSRYHVIERFE